MNAALRERFAGIDPVRRSGTVTRVAGAEVEVRGLRVAVGEALTIRTDAGLRAAEVVGLGEDRASALLLDPVDGLAQGDQVTRGAPGGVRPVGAPSLIGRVLDGLGRPLDDGPVPVGDPLELQATPPAAMRRGRIREPLPVGVRVVDTMTAVGRGQRLGIFAGSGVGKSTLLGMMARGSAADVTVVALVGERGREVREFLEDDLGPQGRERSVVVVATSDEPPLVRIRAALLATAIAEWFADHGKHVLLLTDSLTRLAHAQREVGLAAGEPPTARGYTPSVFSLLARLLERQGPRAARPDGSYGTITGLSTVLVDGDDLSDPVVDAARGILDGHLVLDRGLADAGRYPPVEPLQSLSRTAPKVLVPEQLQAAAAARAHLAAVAEVRDLVEVGAYQPGTNAAADAGLAVNDALVTFLRQSASEVSDAGQAWQTLAGIVGGRGAA